MGRLYAAAPEQDKLGSDVQASTIIDAADPPTSLLLLLISPDDKSKQGERTAVPCRGNSCLLFWYRPS